MMEISERIRLQAGVLKGDELAELIDEDEPISLD
jgi:hypothetical protein